MIFRESSLAGAFIIDLECHQDERGFFARSFCRREFAAHDLDVDAAQASVSFNHRRGTLRGLHFQRSPYAESKLIRCVTGAVYDVIVDLRCGSSTFGRHLGVELTAANRRQLFVPKGFAHGFQCLADDTELLYQMSTYYAPNSAAGLRWNDPALGISWPLDVEIISAQDQAYGDFQGATDARLLPFEETP